MRIKLILSILKLWFELESSVKSMSNILASVLGILTFVGRQKDTEESEDIWVNVNSTLFATL